jgi:hypothetical protein
MVAWPYMLKWNIMVAGACGQEGCSILGGQKAEKEEYRNTERGQGKIQLPRTIAL